jgi:hypothetical protein
MINSSPKSHNEQSLGIKVAIQQQVANEDDPGT